MQKTLYIPIDTTLDNTVECEKLVKRGDTLTLTIKVFTNGVLANLTGQTVDLILRKSDNTIIESTITNVANGIVTAMLSQQATLANGIVSGELQIYTSTTHLGTNTFIFNVDESIADDVLAESESEIETLVDLKNVIDSNNATISEYVSNITQIAGTAESVQALVGTKLYIDNNLADLQQENAEAVINIANETIQNDEATQNIIDLDVKNSTATSNITSLDSKNSIAETNIVYLDAKNLIATDNISDLDVKNATASANISDLDSKNATASANIIDIDAENIRAEANIVAMEGFGDVTELTQTVTNIKNEVETARGASVNLDTRLDLVDSSLSDKVNKVDNTKQLGGGYIINGDFRVNQRVVSGTVTLTAGQYGHDRWKAGASGCTYTFATSGGVTTITITAGSLIQVIEGTSLQTGTYVLSWGGTCQGKMGAGSYSASGVSASVTGGTNLNIEFGTGTLSNAKLEKNTIATPFIQRHYGEELTLCQRYFQILSNQAPVGYCHGVSNIRATIKFNIPMRISPTPTIIGSNPNFNNGTANFTTSTPSTKAISVDFWAVNVVASGLTASTAGLLEFATSNITLDAEI